MKILAIDSSGLVASAALLADGILVAEYTVDYKKTHSQTLLPMVDEILRGGGDGTGDGVRTDAFPFFRWDRSDCPCPVAST